MIDFSGKARKILVADDNEANRVLVKDLLLPLGFEIMEAVDGRDMLDNRVKEIQEFIQYYMEEKFNEG